MTDRRLPPSPEPPEPDSERAGAPSPREEEDPSEGAAPGRQRQEIEPRPLAMEATVAADSLELAISRLRARAWRVHGGAAALSFVAAALVVVALASLALGLGAGGWVRPIALALLLGLGAAALIHARRRAGTPSAAELARTLEDRDPRATGLTTAVELAAILASKDSRPSSASGAVVSGALRGELDPSQPPDASTEPQGELDPSRPPSASTALPRATGLSRAPSGGEATKQLSFSSELAWAHISVAAGRAVWLGPERAFPLEPLRRAAAAAVAAVVVLAPLFLLTAPLGSGLRLLALGADEAAAPAPRLSPITGDIALTYLYPRYTGLPPRTLEGTNGEISALRGTQVRIETRADREVAKAFLDVSGAATPLEVEGGRQLRGSLQVQGDGSYAFRFEDARGRTLAVGPPIPIVAVNDAVPTISIEAPVAELVLTERDSVELLFDAADDFGVSGVELVYRVAGGDEERIGIGSYAEPKARVSGSHLWEMSTLGVRPGDTISYYLRAKDNDEVGGAKWGQSRTQQIKIFSEAEHRRELIAKVEESWEKMILALGDRVSPRQGPRKVEDAQRLEAGRPADAKVQEVAVELRDVAVELGEDERAPVELLAAIRNISQGLLVKSAVTRDRRSRGGLLSPQGKIAFVTQLDLAEADEQRELEQGILYLEAMLDRQRLAEIEELARELAADRRELANLLEQYRDAPSDEAKSAIRQELSRLKARMAEMMKRMSQLGKGLQDEHLNAEAMQALSKERDMLSQLDEVERLLAEGKTDEALAELQKLGMQMDEMSKALSDASEGQAENDPTLKQIAEDMQKYEEDLDQLARDQQQLAEATQALRREQSRELREKLAKEGNGLLEELRQKIARAQAALNAIPDGQIPQRSVDDLAGAGERLDDLDKSLLSKDFDAAQESAAKALAHGQALERDLDQEAMRMERYAPAEARRLGELREDAATGARLVREVKEKLDELFSNPRQQMSQQQKSQSQRLAQRQGELGQKMEQLREQAEKVGQQAPIFDEEAKQSMEGAQRSMSEAQGKLQGQDPGGALASERSAQEHLQTLKRGLEEAKERAQQSGGGSGFPMPMSSGGGRGRSGGKGNFDGKEKVAIPGADQYKAPEEYRKEILDAMKQGSPQGFQENVRDYYQEIVK